MSHRFRSLSPTLLTALAVAVLSLAAGGCSESSVSGGGTGDPDDIPCVRELDCPLGYTCNLLTQVCESLTPPVDEDEAVEEDGDTNPDADTDGDDPVDGDDADDDPVTEEEPEPEPEPEPDIERVGVPCTSNADCPYFNSGTGGQRCNTNSGFCEWCDPICDAGKSCNWDGTLWYCGTPCNPPCADGQACQLDQCVRLACTQPCQQCYRCDATTGFICKRDPNCNPNTDQDRVDVETRSACLPSNAPCGPGTICCSGTCLMGYCM